MRGTDCNDSPGSLYREDAESAHSGIARTSPPCFVSAFFRGKDVLTFAATAEAITIFSILGFSLAEHTHSIQDPLASGMFFGCAVPAYTLGFANQPTIFELWHYRYSLHGSGDAGSFELHWRSVNLNSGIIAFELKVVYLNVV